MSADCGDALFVPQVVFSGFVGAEGHQFFVVPNAVEDDVVAPGKALRDGGFPDTTLDTASPGTALAVLKSHLVQRQVVHLRIDVGDPVQQHASFMGVAPVIGERVRVGQRGNAPLYPAPHGFEIVVCDDIVSIALFVEHAVPVVYI